MPNRFFRFAWLGTLLVAVTLACNLFSGIGEDVRDARNTAEAIATQARGLGEQAQGLATAFNEGIATAQAIATEEGPELLGTGRALLTQAAESGFLQTAQAEITEEGGEFLATLNAAATQGLDIDLGDRVPEDIPVVDESTVTYSNASDDFVSYETTLDYPTTLDFYKMEMPAQGWTEATGSVEAEDTAVLYYEKPDRAATVTMTVNTTTGGTTVQVILTRK